MAQARSEIARLDPPGETQVVVTTRLNRSEFARQYHLITRNERLDAIAADVVDHYRRRPR